MRVQHCVRAFPRLADVTSMCDGNGTAARVLRPRSSAAANENDLVALLCYSTAVTFFCRGSILHR